MIKVVLDTNMLLSAFLFGGMVEIIIDSVAEERIDLYCSPTLQQEVLRKLTEYGAKEELISQVKIFFDTVINVLPTIKIDICRDPNDNFLLELAETAQADFLITRDKDLLDLPDHRWKETKIVKPEEFLSILRKINLIG